ncbi:hypothetical protein [Halalkalicoccus subterraneus]|uniref:hypothetical protein n=1 Tax=Halalkalicoccus subterraneus TaxID=2675002 RepID=UPI000EFBAE53|nr:hypothetical protein [Halalkalicoccus subterraneus]
MNDDEPAYARKLRSRPGKSHPLDGGAIAAGLCFGVLAILVSIAGPLSAAVRLSITAFCLFFGGITAGYLTRPTASGAVQGIAVVCCTAGLMVAVSVSVSIGAGSLLRVPLVFAYDALSVPAFAALGLLSLCFGVLSGAFGARLRR